MSADLTFIPEWIQERMEEFVEFHDKKKRSKRGYYASMSKKDMEGWLNEAHSLMRELLAEAE